VVTEKESNIFTICFTFWSERGYISRLHFECILLLHVVIFDPIERNLDKNTIIEM